MSPVCSHWNKRPLWNVLNISWLSKPSKSSARDLSWGKNEPVAAKFLRNMISSASTARYSSLPWRAVNF